MTDKIVRYISWGVGSLLVLALLVLNDDSFSMYGLFATDIKDTMVYDFLKDIVRDFPIRSSTSRTLAYFLWFGCFGGGIFISWKCRFKTAKIAKTILNSIHEKA
jgi:hypothetical protein